VVVVGAGIIGCAIARELSSRGIACTVVEHRAVAAGATQASAGMLAPHVEAHEPGPLLDLGVRSLRLFPDWIAAVRSETGLDVEFEVIGTLEVATDEERASALRHAADASGRWLDAAELARLHPELAPSRGARLTAEHGYVVPGELATALALAAERHGARLHQARVERVTRDGGSLRVHTTDGTLTTTAVILAAGSWTNAIEGIHTPPIHPVRGQIVRLAWPVGSLRSIVWGPDCYVVPRRDRTILVGATMEEAGFDERTTASGVRDLLAAACDLLPDARRASFLEARAGLRPATSDGLPAIGGDPASPGVFHASGHFRNGVLLAPITAKLIADLIVDDRADACLESFRVDRFD
jgi:glycine oxidase